jgi:hypothetical protein
VLLIAYPFALSPEEALSSVADEARKLYMITTESDGKPQVKHIKAMYFPTWLIDCEVEALVHWNEAPVELLFFSFLGYGLIYVRSHPPVVCC